MSDTARNILDNLKEQFALYKKQTAILASLSIVLIAVVVVRFVDDSPRPSAAAEPEAPSDGSDPIAVAPEAGDAEVPTSARSWTRSSPRPRSPA